MDPPGFAALRDLFQSSPSSARASTFAQCILSARLPWLSNKHRLQVDQSNYFIDQTLVACQLAWQFWLEHPEDLGATTDHEIPASIWQWESVRELQVSTKAVTFAIFQCMFEAPTSKPTRFLTTLQAFLECPQPYSTWPCFDWDRCHQGALIANTTKPWWRNPAMNG